MLCGRYEGVDQRVLDDFVDEEISLGDYVISGGEIPSMVIMEGVCRLISGTIDDEESVKQESFQNNLLDHPHFTRPEIIDDKKVASNSSGFCVFFENFDFFCKEIPLHLVFNYFRKT